MGFRRKQKRQDRVRGGRNCLYGAGNSPLQAEQKNVFGWVVSLSAQVQRDVAQAKVLHYLDPRWIEDVVMLSGKKKVPNTALSTRYALKTYSAARLRSALSRAIRAEKSFKAVRSISYGSTKSRRKIFTRNAVCAFSISAAIFSER